MMGRGGRIGWFRAAGAAALLLLPGLAAGQTGVHVGLTPSPQNVTPGTDFTVELTVTQPGLAFNGYDAVISYDPAVLTFLPASPTSLQEGTYMTGVCGNTFHIFSAAGDSLSIADVLLCSGASLTGPGQLYMLRFHASNTPQLTYVRIRFVQFYNAGLYVNPAFTTDAQIFIGGGAAVGTESARGVSLSATPNPNAGRVSLSVASPIEGPQRLMVLDLAGRRVRVIDEGVRPAGARTLSWDGRDGLGRRLPAGIYLVVLTAGGRTATTRIAMLQ